jgi:hypothetical protein
MKKNKTGLEEHRVKMCEIAEKVRAEVLSADLTPAEIVGLLLSICLDLNYCSNRKFEEESRHE